MNILDYILFGKKYGICIFCGRKIKKQDTVYHKNTICICKECNSTVDVAPFLYVYEGTEHISYTIAPLYFNDIIREAIHKLKFSSLDKIADGLCYYLNTYLSVFEESDTPILRDFDFLVPVPLSKEHFYKRGFNQSDIIARCVSEKFNIPVKNDILIKSRHTKTQSTLDRSARKANTENAYSVTGDVGGKNIILIDDIYTTGATLDSCAGALKAAGAEKIIAITLVHGAHRPHSDTYYDMFG